MKRITLAALALLALAPAAPLRAQQTTGAAAEAEVAAVIRRLFDGMRAGDSTVVRSVFHPAARLMTTGVRPDGQPVVRADSIDAFVRAVGTPHEQVWDERIDGLEVRVDGPLATAWMRYTFYAGDRLSHCGVNAFQLFRAAEGWKVIQITDTRRREGCPELPPTRGG
jgi:putative lumazine-binding protein